MDESLFQSLDKYLVNLEGQKIIDRVASLFKFTEGGEPDEDDDGVGLLFGTKKIVIEDKLETAYASLCLEGDLRAYNVAISSVCGLLDTSDSMVDENFDKKYINDVITSIKCLCYVESHLNELNSKELRVAKYLDGQNQYGQGNLIIK